MAYDKEELVSSVLGKMSLNGMRAVTANAVEISAVSSALIEGRVKPFLKQVELTERYWNANVRYAWLPSSKETYGMGC